MFGKIALEERSVRLVIEVTDPQRLDVATREIRWTSCGKRYSFELPVRVQLDAPLSRARYDSRKRLLRVTLRRPFASSTWDLFDEVDATFARMQQQARRLLGEELDAGVQVAGSFGDKNNCEVRVEHGKGIVIDLQSSASPPEDRPTIVMGRTKEMIYLPWAADVEESSSDTDPQVSHSTARKAQLPDVNVKGLHESTICKQQVAARIARQARKLKLRVGKPRATRADGQSVRGASVFTDVPREAGELVACYKGTILRKQDILPSSRAQRFYMFLDDAYIMDGGTGGPRPSAAHITSYINSPAGCVSQHGTPLQANLRIQVDPRKGLGQHACRLIAARDILAGQELLLHYGDEYNLMSLSPESSDDEVYTAFSGYVAEASNC